jgi:uncharacterized protein YdhG (YjbR/CyaY superfamily)
MAAETISAYISATPAGTRPILRKVRATIRRALPRAKETISYRIPAFALNGKIVVYFAAFRHHIGLYPPVRDAALRKAATRYAGPKGNLRFPLDEPIPYGLIGRIAKARARAISGSTGTRKRKRVA